MRKIPSGSRHYFTTSVSSGRVVVNHMIVDITISLPRIMESMAHMQNGVQVS